MSIKDALSSSKSAKSAKFENPGDGVKGIVESSDLIDSRDSEGKIVLWDDGKPQQKVRIIIQTTLDNGPDEDGVPDDGRRAVYVKWWGAQKKAMVSAIRNAQADDVVPGGTFAAVFLREGDKVKKSWSATKLYAYEYIPPTEEWLEEAAKKQMNAPLADLEEPRANSTATEAEDALLLAGLMESL